MREQDRRLCRQATEYAGDSDAAEKEDLQLPPICPQCPQKPSCQEAVVEALIRRKCSRAGGYLGRHSKDPATDRVVPEEHLEDQESDMAQSYEPRQNIREGFHVGFLCDAERAISRARCMGHYPRRDDACCCGKKGPVRRTFLGAVVGGAAALAVPRLSRAAQSTFPKKPIKIIVTADAGGGEDTEARGIAPYVQKHLGVSVLIENQPGAGGKIAFEKFQRTEPDGYTLITFTFPKSIIIEYLDKTTRYRTRDFTPVFAWSRSNQLLLVHADAWKSFDEFLKAAKARTLRRGGTRRRVLTAT